MGTDTEKRTVSTPVVILEGPPASGKSRLARAAIRILETYAMDARSYSSEHGGHILHAVACRNWKFRDWKYQGREPQLEVSLDWARELGARALIVESQSIVALDWIDRTWREVDPRVFVTDSIIRVRLDGRQVSADDISLLAEDVVNQIGVD